jgi:hypothetical protein
MTGHGIALVYLRCGSCAHTWETAERRQTPIRSGPFWW